MYAYIVNNAWTAWASQDMPSFLRIVGTPMLRETLNDSEPFHEASGFYVLIEKGWSVRYDSELGSKVYFENGLSKLMEGAHIN
jgi:hypothetical protein